MKTLTASAARQSLGSLLTQALAGKDIGIVWHGQVIALRAVGERGGDEVLSDYALKPKELVRATRKLERQARHEHKTGKAKVWDGSFFRLRSGKIPGPGVRCSPR